jgi:hypothetical protein
MSMSKNTTKLMMQASQVARAAARLDHPSPTVTKPKQGSRTRTIPVELDPGDLANAIVADPTPRRKLPPTRTKPITDMPSFVVTTNCHEDVKRLGTPTDADRIWLESLEIRQQLRQTGAFDQDALVCRQFQQKMNPHLAGIRLSKCDMRWGAQPKASSHRFVSQLAAVLGRLPAEQWRLCRSCRGGHKPRFTTKPCSRCHGLGYLMTHTHDEKIAKKAAVPRSATSE